MSDSLPLRRIRVRYFPQHIPPVWEAMYEPPGRVACYCHADSLEAMCEKLRDYFEGRGAIEPLHIERRFLNV
jgi:hypothetical protein